MKLEFDLKELQKLNDKLKDLAESEFNALLDDTANMIAQVFLKNVTKMTPVDTGFLRGNWDIVRGRYHYQVYNNTIYGIYVNYGHRTRNGGWVEGQFFVEKSMEMTERSVKKIVRESLIKPLERYLNG